MLYNGYSIAEKGKRTPDMESLWVKESYILAAFTRHLICYQ